MKNKGVMISLAALVLIGMMITTGTHNFIKRNSPDGSGAASQVTAAAMDEAAREEEVKEDLAEAMPLTAGTEKTADGDTLEDATGEQHPERLYGDSGEGGESRGAEDDSDSKKGIPMEDEPVLTSGMQKSADVISYGEISEGPQAQMEELMEDEASDMVSAQPQSYYEKRLQDLDSQIQKNRENQTGANVNSSVKSAVTNELKLWDSELNDIYNAVLERLGQEESEELVKEEREWLKERDSLAMDAAKKSTGGSSESIEYTVSLMESTRQRAYELAERYAGVLEE